MCHTTCFNRYEMGFDAEFGSTLAAAGSTQAVSNCQRLPASGIYDIHATKP
jgi:hypothetical protein